MNDSDYDRKLDELERLLNDPDCRMEPDRVWTLLAEISRHDEPPMAATPVAGRAAPCRLQGTA